MRLLYVTDTYFPVISGSAIIVERYAKEIAKRGHQITILAMGDKLDLTEKKVNENLTVYSIPSMKNLTRADHYIPVILPWQVKQITQKFEPELIHIFSPGTLGLWLRKYAYKNNIKCVTSVFGVPEFATSFFNFLPRYIIQKANDILWKYYSWFYKNVDAVTVLSVYPKAELVKHGVQTNIEVIPMWVNNSQKCPSDKSALYEKYDIPKDKKIFLYLGRVDKDKDLDTLIKAFSLFMQNDINKEKAFLIVAGDGKERKHLEDMSVKWGVQKYLRFTGLIKPDKVYEIYCISDYFIMPGPYETQSIATVEAIAYGLKAIVAGSGALPEIQTRLPKDCFTFDVFEPSSLAQKMQKVFNEETKNSFAPGKFHYFYSKKSSIDKLEALYLKTLKKD